VKKVGRVANSNPAALLHKQVTAALEKAGIAVTGKKAYSAGAATGDDSEKEWTYLSPSRDDVLRTMMFRSDNLYAEAMLRAPLLYGDSVYADISAETAVASAKQLWKSRGVDLSNGRLVDGSGLAPVNRISAKMLTDILGSMADSVNYVGVFPAVGREGTVKYLLRETALEGRMVLKSGSMTGVVCYAGYMLDDAGKPTHAVAVMVNNFSCSKAKVKSAISDYLLRLFK
jgi:D-alanyl-D-alanine carboxypeptidase/D-alanyl-D-alanine-endopeptidase (penicillin-binding protein 4)